MAPRVKKSVSSEIVDPKVQKTVDALQGVKTKRGEHAPVNKTESKTKRKASPRIQLSGAIKALLNSNEYTATTEKVKTKMLASLSTPKMSDKKKRKILASICHRVYNDCFKSVPSASGAVEDFHDKFINYFGSPVARKLFLSDTEDS